MIEKTAHLGANLLLVEDDTTLALLLRDLLAEQGYRVGHAADAAQGLELLAAEDYQLLLLDYSLPDMKAPAFLETARGRGISLPPFVITTGVGDEKVAVAMMKCGARDYLVKDLQLFDRLPEVVQRLLREVLTEGQLADARRDLAESETRFQYTFEQAAVGMSYTDLGGRLLHVNRKLAELIGYTVADLQQRRLQEFLLPENQQQELPLLEQLLREESSTIAMEKRYRHKDGRVVWVVTTATLERTLEGLPHRIFRVVQDITERKRLEKLLENITRDVSGTTGGSFLRTIIIHLQQALGMEAAQIGEVADGKVYCYVCRMDEQWLDSLEYSLAGSPCAQVVGSGQVLTVGRDVRAEFPEGQQLVALGAVSYAGVPLVGGDGKVFGLMAFIGRRPLADMHLAEILLKSFAGRVAAEMQRQLAEDALQLALARAQEANRTKSEFLANMSHELRTPLNGALGMLQLLETTELTIEQLEYAKIASNCGWNLLRLLNDLLDLSKIEAGKMDIAREPFFIEEVVRSALDIFISTTHQKGVALGWRLADDLPAMMLGDSMRIRQILFNLVGNAVKFTDRGSIAVHIGLAESGALLRLVVEDTGIGIGQELLTRIFEPFTQEDSTFQRRYQGAGLGLSIVKRLSALMGGDVTIHSTPGVGSRVEVLLEVGLTAADLPLPATTSSLSSLPPAPRRVLVVEDNEINRHAVGRLLAHDGHLVIDAGNGMEAIAALEKESVDLILMDIQMPLMDGLETTRAIRQGKAGAAAANIPIIALTAYAMRGDGANFLAAGMNAHLAKPITLEELRGVMGEWGTAAVASEGRSAVVV